MNQYFVKKNNSFNGGSKAPLSLIQGTSLMNALLRDLPPGEEATFTVVDHCDRLKAVATNRRIEGTFIKQVWGGRKNDDAMLVREVSFDATDAIMKMTYEEVIGMKDCEDSSDALGRDHVDWDGPHEVYIEDEIRAYFGVAATEDLTPEAFEFVKTHGDFENRVVKKVTLSVEVEVSCSKDDDLDQFIDKMTLAVKSNTPGVVVLKSDAQKQENEKPSAPTSRPKC